VVLVSQLLGSNVTINSQGTGSGSGTGSETSTPSSNTGTGTGSSITDNAQGTVQDVIIQPRIGKLQYLVVSFSAENWIPVPISLVGWDATNNQIALLTAATMLQNAPTYSAGQSPATSTADWDQQFSTYWNGGGTGTGSGGTNSVTATATP
jgi:hypothetical protein